MLLDFWEGGNMLKGPPTSPPSYSCRSSPWEQIWEMDRFQRQICKLHGPISEDVTSKKEQDYVPFALQVRIIFCQSQQLEWCE